MNPAVHPVDIVRVGAHGDVAGRDVAATEEPLEIRLGSASFVTGTFGLVAASVVTRAIANR